MYGSPIMVPQGSPRLSLDGLTLQTLRSSDSSQRSPKVQLRLTKTDYPAEGIDCFSPLRLPDSVEIVLQDLDSTLLEYARGQFECELRQGPHRFPLAGRRHFVVEVAAGTTASLQFEVGPPPVPSLSQAVVARVLGTEDPSLVPQKRVIQSLDLKFSQPLVLLNVLQALVEAQGLFTQKGLGRLFRGPFAMSRALMLREQRPMDRFSDLLELFADSADRLGAVYLTRIHGEAVARARPGEWELRLYFSGHVHVAGTLPVPFENLVLPSMVLPVPFATLDALLSESPLASASINRQSVQVEEAMSSLRGLIESLRGEFSLATELPECAVEAMLVDRTDIEVAVRLPQKITLSGQLEGESTAEVMTLRAQRLAVGFPEAGLQLGVKAQIEGPVAGAGPYWSRLKIHLENTVKEGSTIPSFEASIATRHPTATGSATAQIAVKNLRIEEGAGGLSIEGRDIDLWPMSRRIMFACDVSTTRDLVAQEAGLRNTLIVPEGSVTGSVELGTDGLWHVGMQGQADYTIETIKQVPEVPELDLSAGSLRVDIQGGIELTLAADANLRVDNALDVTVREASVLSRVDKAQIALEDRRIVFPEGTELALRTKLASFSASEIGEASFDLTWDMHDCATYLHVGDRKASLLAPDLREGEVTVNISPEGRLSFRGEREGLYGIRYFNTLVNPGADPDHALEILRSEEAIEYVFSALEVLSPELAQHATQVREVILGARKISDRAGIRGIRDLIPRANIARLSSLMLAGDESYAERIGEQVRRATEGRGLDVIEVKNILRAHFDPFDADYEIAGIVRWLNALVSPLEPIVDEGPKELPPLCETKEYATHVAGLPSAAELYKRVDEGTVDGAFSLTLCRYAVLMTSKQLEYILARADERWEKKQTQWLRHVHAAKLRVEKIGAAYGGVEYALQNIVIANFLGEAIGDGSNSLRLTESSFRKGAKWPPACAIGPQEVAVLLKAGLALDRQDRQTQINNRMLIDLLQQRSREFLQDVLTEIGQDNPNALSGVLFAFLDQEQDHMKAPIDLASMLESKLGIAVPRRREFMAGGRKAKSSYYEALAMTADAIMAMSTPHVAQKAHVQTQRHAIATSYRPKAKAKDRIKAAREAIERADELGSKVNFAGKPASKDRQRASAAYEAAIAACRAVLREDELAFQSSWLKSFWQRNEEALKLLSVVRNYQDDVDSVRAWLHRTSGAKRFADEQHLLDAVIETLIYDGKDKKKLATDPLVRLLLDEPSGAFDFTLVSCMGVITQGEQGTELEDSYRRLVEKRGIRIVRAPTGTAMTVEQNAQRIIQSIERVTGPYGYVGYSQGCTNALAAESELRGGTPAQQRLLDRLVCRNLLFSAFNGSAHGTNGSKKFLQALIEGEKFLKHYQVEFSSEAVGAFLRIVKAVLDSPLFVQVLGGVHSVTPDRAESLHRDLQIVEHATTSSVRAVTTEERIPETLEFTFYMLRQLVGGAEQDTQVLASDALGTSTRVINESTKLLARCDMGSLRQASHHWAPLLRECAIVTTDRDLETRVYESPKDRLVIPWIEVNHRFGLIGDKGGDASASETRGEADGGRQ